MASVVVTEAENENLPKLNVGDALGEWLIREELGRGAFATVYLVSKNSESSENAETTSPAPQYAMKVEQQASGYLSNLKMDVVVLRLAQKHEKPSFCAFVDAGRCDFRGAKLNFVVMARVGKDLEEYRNQQPEKKFSLGCALRIGNEVLSAVKQLHSLGFLHRDIKPTNFAVDYETQQRILIFDFGLCRAFRDEKGRIKLPRELNAFRGTLRYASLNAHMGRELSRRDDLESFFYLLVEFTNGTLPWRTALTSQKALLLKERCRFGDARDDMLRGCPAAYTEILGIIDGTLYYHEPDYGKMFLLMDLIVKDYKLDTTFDWIRPEEDKEKDK